MPHPSRLLRLFLPLSVLLLARTCLAAPNDSIFLCVDSEGRKTYQNASDGPSCRRLDGIVSTIPSADLGRGRAHPVVSRPMLTPASFPRVEPSTQRSRDSDRRRILEDELRSEQERLAQLRTEFNQGRPSPSGGEAVGTNRYQEHVQRLSDDIQRSEGNIASLRRELTPLRY